MSLDWLIGGLFLGGVGIVALGFVSLAAFVLADNANTLVRARGDE